MPCFLPKITIFVPDHTDRNMKKAITIIFLTVLSVLNLSAAEIDSLFSRWEEATGMHRIRLGNELLSLGYDEGLVSEKKILRQKSVHRIRGTHIRHDVILFLHK